MLAKIAEMPEPDRAMAERLHAIITANAPALSPRLWYGMPAYAKDGKVVCFFQSAEKFKTRYATLGFNDDGHPRRRHHVADRLRADGADRRRRGEDRRAREEGGGLRAQLTNGGTQIRTGDTTIFSRVLYQLSYPAAEPRIAVGEAFSGRSRCLLLMRLRALKWIRVSADEAVAVGAILPNHYPLTPAKVRVQFRGRREAYCGPQFARAIITTRFGRRSGPLSFGQCAGGARSS